jgi:DNA-binding NarL/FixJ family response regulator
LWNVSPVKRRPLLPKVGTVKAASLALSVIVADDSLVVRERLVGLLREVPGVSVVGETGDVAGTLEALRRLRPTVLVLDLSMPGGSGLTVLQQVRKEQIQSKVIVLTNYSSAEYEKVARARGASAFLNKSTEFMKVADLVRELAPPIEFKTENGSNYPL